MKKVLLLNLFIIIERNKESIDQFNSRQQQKHDKQSVKEKEWYFSIL